MPRKKAKFYYALTIVPNLKDRVYVEDDIVENLKDLCIKSYSDYNVQVLPEKYTFERKKDGTLHLHALVFANTRLADYKGYHKGIQVSGWSRYFRICNDNNVWLDYMFKHQEPEV